jgi:hypothetical protein
MPRSCQPLGVASSFADSAVYVVNVIDNPQKPRGERIFTEALVVIDECFGNLNRGNPEPTVGQR